MHDIMKVFRAVHIYISSDADNDLAYIRNRFMKKIAEKEIL